MKCTGSQFCECRECERVKFLGGKKKPKCEHCLGKGVVELTNFVESEIIPCPHCQKPKDTPEFEPCFRPWGYGKKECPITSLDDCHGFGICSKNEKETS